MAQIIASQHTHITNKTLNSSLTYACTHIAEEEVKVEGEDEFSFLSLAEEEDDEIDDDSDGESDATTI